MVRRVPLGRQSPCLDRVGEDRHRAIGDRVGPLEGVAQIGEVMAAEVSDRGRELGVVEPPDQPLQLAPAAPARGQALAQLCTRAAQQPLVLLVGHRVDPLSQRLAARSLEEAAEQPAVLDGDRLPASGLEHRGGPGHGDLRHDPVERLAVDVDDPEHLAQVRGERVHERLPDRTLVELGVAEDRDLSPAARHLEVPGHVAVGERAPERRGRADAHGPRREVHGVGVLRTARVALQAPEGPQLGQVAAIEAAEQVVDRVQHRARVWLHRHPVRAPQVLEVERGHDAHERRRGGLMAAHLHAGGRHPDLVGVVHEANREPQHTTLQRVQSLERRIRVGLGRRCSSCPDHPLISKPITPLQATMAPHNAG